MTYTEKIGNLFDVAMVYTLAHCISLDCAMGAGIAKEFNNRYPNMKRTLLLKQRQITDAILYKDASNHGVFNLITKAKYYHKPKRNDFNSTIVNLKKQMLDLSIDKLAIPLLGAGLDRLDWGRSSEFIQQCFEDTSVEILVVRLN